MLGGKNLDLHLQKNWSLGWSEGILVVYYAAVFHFSEN